MTGADFALPWLLAQTFPKADGFAAHGAAFPAHKKTLSALTARSVFTQIHWRAL
jgi:hypothetical protein